MHIGIYEPFFQLSRQYHSNCLIFFYVIVKKLNFKSTILKNTKKTQILKSTRFCLPRLFSMAMFVKKTVIYWRIFIREDSFLTQLDEHLWISLLPMFPLFFGDYFPDIRTFRRIFSVFPNFFDEYFCHTNWPGRVWHQSWQVANEYFFQLSRQYYSNCLIFSYVIVKKLNF